MASLSCLYSLLLLCTTATFKSVAAETFQVDLHHRFSDKVRQWAESQGFPSPWNPEEAPEGSVEYYNELARHDQALLSQHGRLLKDTGVYSFAMSNETVLLPSLGYLHYAPVSVGTPNQTFLVAVSTGSDLFWLPCNCKQCAPLTSPLYEDLEFKAYSISESSTSKEILCDSSQCNLLNDIGETCTGTSSNCPYHIEYALNDTSSSGFLVEDVLYLAQEGTGVDTVQVPILFGCGEAQTGAFLDTIAPNGLMGLGVNDVSVPSMLTTKGLISDSFSMCFGSGGSGRLMFGDKGSSNQSETSLIMDKHNSQYSISLDGMVIGNTTSETSFTAQISSGASFTYLTDQIYKEFTSIFTEQVTDTPLSVSTVPFEYCYEWSAAEAETLLPVVSLTTRGGSQFPVLDPIIHLTSNKSQDPIGYCLGVLPSTDKSIIGQNFLAGLRIVFNREDEVLGWEKFDCYNGKSSTTHPKTDKNASAPSADVKAPEEAPSADAKAPEAPHPGTSQLPRTKSWAPNLSPSTMFNTALSFFLLGFLFV